MTDPPLRADEILVGCVTEDTPKYLGQTLRLVQSIRWFGGELARARVIVGAVERIDPRVRRALEALGAEIRVLPRFEPRNGSANRLQLFAELRDEKEQNYLMLDCDTIVVRDPLPMLRGNVFHAKIAPFPTVTHDVFVRLFAHFGLPLPARSHVTGYTGTPTIPYFNAGVFSISAELAARLVPEWRYYNALLAAEPALVAPCEKNLHQAALAIALAKTGIPVAETGPELNFQLNATHVAAPPGYAEVEPFIIHYHHLVDDAGMLLPTPFPRAQERIERFNERLREERLRATRLPERKAVSRSSPKQIAVVGMHRSGTSLVARLLSAMGCYAGEEHDLPPPDIFNPTGYWEHRDVWALDEAILAALDASWLEPARADLARLDDKTRKEFVERARAIVRRLDENGTWMVKDPRLALVFPIWREAMKAPICVLVWREPAGVAASLAHRDGLSHGLGLALWEEYTRAMLATTTGLTRVCVSYDDLLANPIEGAAKIYRALVAAGAADLRLPSDDELRTVIDPALDHRGDNDEQTLNGAQSALRDALRSGAALQWSNIPPTHPETRNLLMSFMTMQRENATLKERAGQSDSLLSAVFSSRSWRIGFGLTRLWRRFFSSREETAVDRWRRQPRSG
ncbi:MAG TPA: sulfotransferase, partial [Thermoanaerobaculia bacterium]